MVYRAANEIPFLVPFNVSVYMTYRVNFFSSIIWKTVERLKKKISSRMQQTENQKREFKLIFGMQYF